MFENKKVTIYTTSQMMGDIIKTEASILEHGKRKYAQYDQAPYVRYMKKGSKKAREIIEGYNPFILILEGWGKPDPDSMFLAPERQSNMTVRKGRYASFDKRWREDFNAMIAAYIISNNTKIIADYRS